MAAEFSLQMNEHVVDEVGSRLAAETAMTVVAACMMGSDLSQANGAGEPGDDCKLSCIENLVF